ncbi:TetR/AcrR family transcriptional regulator [Sphingosinicella rhizophila]|uniref:TetR/AcrR family transcriptional regulator n=1 Tax=Sphingosinicella rhizophila TaxID=3050082 RepID=A0ABU3Q6L1_9SPHN|nr:TetR/AcrR family transcriptional regulator [Sphingosinicella sp. GR2756]MDT9598603.1 TetR/AcrR family transcriptional regulator [Sphingosinicella sp. GR2756]
MAKPAQRRTQEERSREMRERLIDAALDCLQMLGYRQTTVARVCARAGVSSGAMLHHFAGKLDLFAAAHDHAFEAIHRRYVEIGRSTPSHEERWRRIVESFWNDATQDRYVVAGNELVLASRSDEALNTRLEATSAMRIGRMRALWKELFADAIDPEPHLLVELTLYLVRSLKTVRSGPSATAWSEEHFARWMRMVDPLMAVRSGPAVG